MTQAFARNSDVMGGTAVFYGTRVPVQTLLDYLEAGETIDDFLKGFSLGDAGAPRHRVPGHGAFISLVSGRRGAGISR
jgi:hypothetical protein